MKKIIIFGTLVMVIAISACKKEAVDKNMQTASKSTDLGSTPANGSMPSYAQLNAELLADGYQILTTDPGFPNQFLNNIGVTHYFKPSTEDYISLYDFDNLTPVYDYAAAPCTRDYTTTTVNGVTIKSCAPKGTTCKMQNVNKDGRVVSKKIITCGS